MEPEEILVSNNGDINATSKTHRAQINNKATMGTKEIEQVLE